MNEGHGWYRGDIVIVPDGRRGLLRAKGEVRGTVMFVDGRIDAFRLDELTWTGECLESTPLSQRDWHLAATMVL